MTNVSPDRCRAFGNRGRAQLISCLSTPQSVTELLLRCTLSQSALSQHLKILRDAEIVTTEREGQHVVYRVTHKKYAALARRLLEVVDAK